jgi:Rrf2 family protein
MKLQISSRIAIFALLELAARPDQQVSVAEVGEKYGISSHHLAKVMHTLARAGLVRSVRGAGGGYVFTGQVRRTTLLDVISLFENIGAGEERALGQILEEVDDSASATWGSVTLATVLKLIERQRLPARAARAART